MRENKGTRGAVRFENLFQRGRALPCRLRQRRGLRQLGDAQEGQPALQKQAYGGLVCAVERRRSHPAALERVQGLPPVVRARYEEGELHVSCTAGAHNLIDVMTVLQEEGATPGRVYSDPPSLNDVFLALTGKDLRD